MSDHHLIVGGQRSGKSRHAERLALQWLAASPAHRVTVVRRHVEEAACLEALPRSRVEEITGAFQHLDKRAAGAGVYG